MSIGEDAGYTTKVRDKIIMREKEMTSRRVDEGEQLKVYGGLRGGMGMETHMPADSGRTLSNLDGECA